MHLPVTNRYTNDKEEALNWFDDAVKCAVKSWNGNKLDFVRDVTLDYRCMIKQAQFECNEAAYMKGKYLIELRCYNHNPCEQYFHRSELVFALVAYCFTKTQKIMKVLCIATCHLIAGGHGSIYEPVREINGKRTYRKGNFSIAKLCDKDYAVLWKNVIVGEFVGPNKELVDRLYLKVQPDEKDVMMSYNYKSALDEIKEAPMWAEKYGFEIR